jgi:S-(hydroxymethyl)glutathione dehydrogenase/alcohol dehydrogenase
LNSTAEVEHVAARLRSKALSNVGRPGVRAAVLRQVGDEALEVRDDVEVVPAAAGEVRVKIAATGVCHSDLSGMNGTIPQPAPAVLGHEGAGVIAEVGEGVVGVKEGDHVIVAWSPPCGVCAFCVDRRSPHLCSTIQMTSMATPRFRIDGQPIFGFAGCGTFAEEVVLPQQAVVPIDENVPLEIASLIGCGVMTGVGAAINTAKVTPGSSVVVFGCGGVGIAAIQGARIAGASDIVAVDLVESKLDDAKRLGATHGTTPDGLSAISQEITGGDGFDYAFEAIGNPLTMRAAYDAVRRGGTAVIIGVGKADATVSFSALELFYSEKRLFGSYYGSADVRSDFHRLLRLWRAGKLDLEGMISRRLDIGEVNDAFAAMRRGEVIRQVVQF